MDFGLSEAQLLLRNSVRQWLAQEAPLTRVREIMESEDGFDRALYRGLAEQGITGLMVPEQQDGLGLDLLDITLAAQEMGRAVAPVDFAALCVLSPLLLREAASNHRAAALLSGIASGDAVVSPILAGRPQRDCGAELEIKGGDEITISGSACYVPQGQNADSFVIASESALYLVENDAPTVTVHPLDNIDQTRRLAEIEFTDAPAALLADVLTEGAVERALQAARITLSADLLGACQQSLVAAVDYAMQREQFDRIIASFQAVKHMCAEIAAEVDPVQSLVWFAAHEWDRHSDDADWLSLQLKAHAGDVGYEAVTKATQVFGGIGFTWECDMHLWYKRVSYARQILGGPVELRARAAEIQLGAA